MDSGWLHGRCLPYDPLARSKGVWVAQEILSQNEKIKVDLLAHPADIVAGVSKMQQDPS
jgi:hypothetical protein